MTKTTKTIDERIEFLQECANLYETDGTSPLSDAEYDREYAELKKLSPDHNFFKEVGGIKHAYGTEIVHKFIMGSLDKDATPEEFGDWFNKTYSNPKGLIFTIAPKVDGSSICITYKEGKKSLVATRGDGLIGFDVTANSDYVDGILSSINTENDYIEVKGECYKNRQDFYENWVGEYKNPRNFASGSLNQKNPLITKERGLNFIAYEIRGIDGISELDKTKTLDEYGFETLSKYEKTIIGDELNSKNIVNIVKDYMNSLDRENLPFDIDGVVFKLNDAELVEEMGTTDGGKRPKAHRAIKFPCDQKETEFIGIEYQIKRTGKLTCTGILAPVELAGTTVSRASVHNLKYMSELGLKLGCKVLIEKRGDIIPQIIKVTEHKGQTIEVPDECPSCGSTLAFDERNVTKWCHNPNCKAKLVANIEHWFKTLNVKGIGEKIIQKLVNEEIDSYGQPMIESISDMYNLRHFTSELEAEFGVKAFANIADAIDSVREITLAKFVEALGVSKIGSMSGDITAIAPTIEDIDKLAIEDITSIEGFAMVKATGFVKEWKMMRKEIDNLLKYVTIKQDIKDSNSLGGKKFCFTGSFSNPSRSEMEQMVVDNGGKKASVGKSLDYLVWDGIIRKGKVEKAENLNIAIITQKDFLAMLCTKK